MDLETKLNSREVVEYKAELVRQVMEAEERRMRVAEMVASSMRAARERDNRVYPYIPVSIPPIRLV